MILLAGAVGEAKARRERRTATGTQSTFDKGQQAESQDRKNTVDIHEGGCYSLISGKTCYMLSHAFKCC